jgi:hypothetical protein
MILITGKIIVLQRRISTIALIHMILLLINGMLIVQVLLLNTVVVISISFPSVKNKNGVIKA